ncbi:MAG TPA: hypothetical protein VNW96_00785 [Mycobacterium sp.]|nr:hypothetical protein [Mycobacterium sp.]
MSSRPDLSAIFDEHVAHEFVAKDVAATMATMSADPFVNHVPTFLPGVAPTGRAVMLPVVVVMGFEGDKVSYERVYWDQASALVQVGVLDETLLPVTGAAQAQKVLDKDLPANTLLNADQKGPPA